MPELVYRFADALQRLLDARSAVAFERRWHELDIETLGCRALADARVRELTRWERALDDADGILLRLLDRIPALLDGDGVGGRVPPIRVAVLERLQHATAAALVGQRYGAAGLRVVVADQEAPLPRRYFAFLALAERHRPSEWPLFERYLTPHAHHAFVGAAAEAARFYPDSEPAERLMALFAAIREDLLLREFLSPRILESLFVLSDGRTLPFFRDLLTVGHTHHDAQRCEVTMALVMVRRFTGQVEPSVKFPAAAPPQEALDRWEALFTGSQDHLEPVVVI